MAWIKALSSTIETIKRLVYGNLINCLYNSTLPFTLTSDSVQLNRTGAYGELVLIGIDMTNYNTLKITSKASANALVLLSIGNTTLTQPVGGSNNAMGSSTIDISTYTGSNDITLTLSAIETCDIYSITLE